MFLEDISVNWWAVILSTVIYFVLGAIWYSPALFGSMWAKHDPSMKDHENKNMTVGLMGELIIGLIMSYVLAVFIEVSEANAVEKGVVVALWAWIGFIATTQFSFVLWGKRSLISYFIHSGFVLVALILMGIAISGLK